MSRIIVFLAPAILAVGLTAQVKAPETVREPSSQVVFPVHLVPPGSTTMHDLAGTAIRTRTIFRVKVYAIGLYVDGEAARAALASYRGTPAARLASDAGFYRRLLDLDVAMTLRLVMTRDLEGPDVAASFDDALTPRVRRAATERGMAGGDAALVQFRGYFNLDEIPSGTEIVFSCDAGGRLATRVAGSPRPDLQSPAMCWALFDVYLGDRPISGEARRTLVGRFPELLSAGRAGSVGAPGRWMTSIE